MRQVNRITGAVLFVIVFSAANAFGCSCIGSASPCHDYGRSAAVFVGTAVSVRSVERPTNRDDADYWLPRTFKFSVEQTFLGAPAAELEVWTGMGGGDCGYNFKLGSRYVVYAFQSSTGNRLGTGICSRTRPVEEAKEDLEFLRSLGALNQGVSISGEVKRGRLEIAKGDDAIVGPLASIDLVVEAEGGERREIKTDSDGRYTLSGLPAGRLKVTLLLPNELATYKPEQEMTVANRGCATVNYLVVDNGRISGRVLDPEGQSTAGVQVALMEAEHANPVQNWWKSAQVDSEGRYSFNALPSGRYLLAVNFTRYPDPNDPTNVYPRTYYPGVSDIAKAEIITVGTGEDVRERDLLLPVRRAPSILTGKVVWDNGAPVSKAGISFREVTYHDSGINNGVEADDQGYFTIKAYVGQTFIIEVRSNRPYSGDPRRVGPMERAEPVRMVFAKPSESVNIVIKRLR